MKIEIDRRAKRISDGVWVYGFLTIDCKGKHVIMSPLDTPIGGFQFHEVIPNSVGRFTGQSDKESRLIFERDYVTDGAITFVVVYNQARTGYWLKPISGKETYDYCLLEMYNQTVGNGHLHRSDLEIIGNTIDNPELIGKYEQCIQPI